MLYEKIRPYLFALPPEVAHQAAVRALQFSGLFPSFSAKDAASQAIQVMGLSFPNRIGMAAGFDKNAQALYGLAKLGFGFIEIGTVTPKPQSGNPKPRLFRIPEDKALLNRLGFNNHGVLAVAKRLRHRPKNIILGVNLGKNKATPNEQAVDDYVTGFKALAPYADYVVLNISSPNTPGLRDLQKVESLKPILERIQSEASLLFETQKKRTPIVVKISPDENNDDLKKLMDLFLEQKIDAVIANNTTLNKAKLSDAKWLNEMGGVSGAPLKQRALEVVHVIHQHTQGALPIIACGGIASRADADERIAAGASLIQLYTGLIYEGPGLISRLK